MTAPFFKYGMFGDETSLVVAFLIGIGFGFFLERAGFGSAKGQITLPKKVRDLLHLREGGVVVFEQEDDRIVIKPAQSLLDYKGYLRGRDKPDAGELVRETARRFVGKKAGKRSE